MKCPDCNFENRDDANFCLECGNKFESICASCSKKMPPTAKFCDECGHNLQTDSVVEAIDYEQPQSYTPKHLADKILTTRSSIEGERKLVTVLFADIANFTSISEKLDPEEIHQIMDGCFKILMDEIHEYEGTINQFTGDGVMALFGAPVAHEDHAHRSCHAALTIQNTMGDYSEKIKNETGMEFKMRIGINSGIVIVGAIGDDLRMDYTAVGDTTNLGSRMETNAKPGQILISENTFKLVKDYFEFNSLGGIDVKGKKEPQEAYELIKKGKVQTRIGASIAKGLTRFVGRKSSMGILIDAFKKAKSGSGQIVGIVGEAGVGKSRLLLEMINFLCEYDHSYLEGRCVHYGGSMSYLPIIDVLKVLFDVNEGDREFVINKKLANKVSTFDKILVNVIPPFQDLLSLNVDDEKFTELEPKVKRERTFEALRDIIVRTSHDMPLILAVEDLHWMDKTSGDFLDYLIGSLANAPVLLILLYRPEYTHQWGSKSYYSQIGLDQLGNESSGDLVRAILQEGDVSTELKNLILNRSAGNPLFMEEFTHALVENGSIEKRDKKYVLSGKESHMQIPYTIQGIIAAILDRLEDNLKRTIQIASVIGRDFAFRILHTITGMREDLKSQLLNLQGLEFIYEKNLFPELEYIFKHALIQEVTYNNLLFQRKKEIHKKIGEAIEDIYIDRLEEFYEMLAYHFSKSDTYDKAYHYFKLSAEKAYEKHSHWEAFRACKNAIIAINEMPKSKETQIEQIEIRKSICIPAHSLGFPEDSLQILEEGIKQAEDIQDNRSLSNFYSQLRWYYMMKGDPDRALHYLEKLYYEAKELHDIDVLASTAMALGMSYWFATKFSKTCEICPPVIKILDAENRKTDFFDQVMAIYPFLCAIYGNALGMVGRFDKGIENCLMGLNVANEIKDAMTLGTIAINTGFLYVVRGDGLSAIPHMENAIKYYEEVNQQIWVGLSYTGLGQALYLTKEYIKAKKALEKGYKIPNDMGLEVGLPQNHQIRCLISIKENKPSQALTNAKSAVDLSIKNNLKSEEAISRIYFGYALGQSNPSQLARAVENIREGISIANVFQIFSYVAQGYLYLGKLYIYSDKTEDGIKNLKMAKKMFGEMGMDFWLKETKVAFEKVD